MATVTATYGTDDIEALTTALQIRCDDAPSNTTTGYNTSNYPSEPAVTYYFSIEKTGEDTLRSPVFSTNSEGTGFWDGVILPAAGSWTLYLRNASTDASVASTGLTAV
jgi:hypothetical protein